MIDRKDTIENLEQNIRWIEEIECHQFPGWGNVTMAMRDAAELLKEQEPVKPFPYHDIYWCGKCGNRVSQRERIMNSHSFLVYRYKYCPDCGRAVKWDVPTQD